MKKVILNAIAASAIAFAAFTASAAETYTLDPNHTNITWSANHLGFSNPNGKFAKAEGTISLDEKEPKNSSVKVTINTGSVITGIEKFDQHLKSKDFFDSEKFPVATFVSNKVDIVSKDTAKVTGDLTLLGITKPAVLDVKLNKIGENPMNKKKTVGFSAVTTIKRSEYGMNYGLPGVSDNVEVMIEAEAAL